MSAIQNERLILTFAKNLVSKQVESKAIIQSLQLLLDWYALDCCAVYEVNQSNCYNLKEKVMKDHMSSRNSFLLEELQNIFSNQQEDNCVLLYNQLEGSASAISICSLFDCHSLILYPISDDDQQILGFLMLNSMKDSFAYSQEELSVLEIALSMLANYISKRMYENKLSFTITSLQDILDNTGIDIYVNDFFTHEILYVNKSMAAPYGGVEKFKERVCWKVLFPDQNGPCEFCPQKHITDEKYNPTKVYTWDYQRAFDGSWFRVFSAAFRWRDGRLAHVVSSADITENKKYEAMVHHMANYDSLTDLPNRRMLLEECVSRINNATTTEKGYILFYDIDGFKNINDSLGHDAGDEFLIQLADFFRNVPLLKDSIYRNGGDEFVAVIGGESITKDHIRNLAHFIQQRFMKPWKLSKGDIYCTTSIGVACYPEDGTTADTLLQIADRAMYHVKRVSGNNLCFGFELD